MIVWFCFLALCRVSTGFSPSPSQYRSVLKVSPTSLSSLVYPPNFITKEIEKDLSSSDQSIKQTVRTRFPPEPNGYLHLGHVKSFVFNWFCPTLHPGESSFCNVRFDDTNPTKETTVFRDAIIEDLEWITSRGLGILPHHSGSNSQSGLPNVFANSPYLGEITSTSSLFPFLESCAQHLVEQSLAYVDYSSPDEIKSQRGTLTAPGTPSPYREKHSVVENKKLFTEMFSGSAGVNSDGRFPVLRAKISMSSPNLNLRDPIIYRIIDNKPYPMYDFSHPITDAVEQITHSICTLEFADHRPLYDWVLDSLVAPNLFPTRPKTRQIEFSRLNLQGAPMSKRKLNLLVKTGVLDDLSDPRLPTIVGLRRRGVPPKALVDFVSKPGIVGISKNEGVVSYSTFEDVVRGAMDKDCERRFGVFDEGRVEVLVKNWDLVEKGVR